MATEKNQSATPRHALIPYQEILNRFYRFTSPACNEKQSFRIAFAPHVVIFASVLVLVVGSSGSKVCVIVERYIVTSERGDFTRKAKR